MGWESQDGLRHGGIELPDSDESLDIISQYAALVSMELGARPGSVAGKRDVCDL